MEAEAEVEKTKSIGAEAEADPEAKAVSKLGSRSGSSWLLIGGSGSGGFFEKVKAEATNLPPPSLPLL